MRDAPGNSLVDTTRTAVQAYEEMKARLPVLKAWEQVATRRGETLAYELFDGTRLARRRDGRITTQKPRKVPIMIPMAWTRGRVDDHIGRMVETKGMTRISDVDIDAFLRTGTLPGSRRGTNYVSLENDLNEYTDRVRRRRMRNEWGARWLRDILGIRTRRDAMNAVDQRFRDNQDYLLKNRIRYHILGGRRGYPGIHRQVVHVMWRRMLDRDVAIATLRAFGRKATVHDYNRVMAVWRLPCGRDGTGDRGVMALGQTHRSAFVFHRLMGPTDARRPVADEIADIPARLRTITGTARVWRATRTWTDPQLTAVARIVARTQEGPRSPTRLPVAIAIAALERIVGRIWPTTLLTRISWLQEEDLHLLTPFLPAMNAAAEEARRHRRVRAFGASIDLVTDMLGSLDEDAYAALARDARNATWQRLDERQAQWHRERAELHRQEDEAGLTGHWGDDARWPPLLGSHSEDGCEAVEILDAVGLRSEALEMTHCVDGYVPQCISGTSRIFSLRSGDDRSTLELQRRNGTWHVRQNHAIENTVPTRALQTFGRKVARAANRTGTPPVDRP